MEAAIRMLQELRGMEDATSGKINEFMRLCDQLKVPCVTVFTLYGVEPMSYIMRRAYVFTKRTDSREHIWYFSPRLGLMVLDRNGENQVPFEQWDPEADLFTDQSLHEGGTNMNPVERERLLGSDR